MRNRLGHFWFFEGLAEIGLIVAGAAALAALIIQFFAHYSWP